MTTQGADWATRLRAIIDEFESGNQTAFAKQIGVSKQSVGKMLRGSTPSGSTLEELVRRYPVVNLEYLLTGRGPVRTPESRSGSAFERGAVEVVEQVEGFVRELRERYGTGEGWRASEAPVIPSVPPSEEERTGKKRA